MVPLTSWIQTKIQKQTLGKTEEKKTSFKIISTNIEKWLVASLNVRKRVQSTKEPKVKDIVEVNDDVPWIT